MISDLNEKKVVAEAKALKEQNCEVKGLRCDVTNEEELRSVLNETQRVYGPIDILINNAGLQYIAPIEEFPTEKFALLIKVMLIAPFITIKHVFPK